MTCLICSSIIPTKIVKQVDKLDSLFLLRILLEIPHENELVENINNSLNYIIICDKCASTIKQCKTIYREICDNIERFWEHQNKILEKFSESSKHKNDNIDNWVFQCRQFVKDRK